MEKNEMPIVGTSAAAPGPITRFNVAAVHQPPPRPGPNCFNIAWRIGRARPIPSRLGPVQSSDVDSDDESFHTKTRHVLRRLQSGHYDGPFARGIYKCPFCNRKLRATDFNSLVNHAESIGRCGARVGRTMNVHAYMAKHKAFEIHLRNLQASHTRYLEALNVPTALSRIYNFDQEDGEKLPEAWARFCSLIRAQPDHDLEKNDLLDIFYSGLTIESRAYLDSCAGCVFRKRTPDDAEELLAKIGRNHDDWSTPEPTPTPIVKKRGMIKLNDEDMREAKKSLKEKGIKPEDVKNLPPIEDICETIPPSSMIEYMKDIVTNKRKVPNEEISTMLANYSFNGKIPKKLGDPGAVIDCNKGMVTFNVDDKEHTVYFPKRIDKDFKFNWSRSDPMVQYKIYNKAVNLPFGVFCAAIGVPQWGSCEKIRGTPRELSDLYTRICNGRSLSNDDGKISSIQHPAIRYFAYFITKDGWSITARRIDDNPRDLLELYRGITGDDCRTIQRGKIRNIQLPAIKYFAYYIGTSILGRENTSNISSYHLAFLNVALTGETPYHLGSLIARRLSSRGPIFGGTIASRILTHLDIPLDSNDVPLTPRKLDIAAMKSHHFVTTNSTIDNIVYKMLFADGNEKEIPLPQQGLFNIDRQSWSLTKEVVEEHMKIQEFHQQHDSENAEPSYDYTVTYPDVSSSTYMEPGRSSSYYEDTTSWGPWE
ncbi:hypothetical protein QYE76_013240 [Lolium multiflorum]|uniref:Uncharacterized protein n=1 Tax=Lolium multiflorum TaxID=4521 RepID=A0AAD8X4D7_LOLMU|nr:hypothetical protein QYE76_013240 [Lolium multiflorum]